MGRPRTPSNVLELRGAFKKNPARRRKDAEGGSPFCQDPPMHMPQGAVPAWNYLVARLPRIALYNSDEIAVELAARQLATYWLTGDADTLKELRQWLAKLGMFPVDRTKIPAKEAEAEKDPYLD
jgi:hypothetical protein